MKVAVLIVNWNGGALLRRCLESLDRQSRPPDHVIVVDNASTDHSLESAGASLGNVELIRLRTNAGFAAANNIAARAAREYDALALLNPDAFPEPDWLEALVAAAEREPTVAAFASQMLLESSPGYLDGAGDSYHVSGRAWRNGHRAPRASWPQRDVDVFAACAAAALYRREAFEDVGGFDEQYFSYFEDVDLGFRMRLRGHRCRYVHSAVVHHMSSAIAGYRSNFAVYHGERNAIWTFVKNMPMPLLLLYLPQHLALNVAALLYYPLRGQGGVVFRAKLDAVRGLPSILRKRTLVQAGRRVNPWTLRRALRRGFLVPYARRYSTAQIAATRAVMIFALASIVCCHAAPQVLPKMQESQKSERDSRTPAQRKIDSQLLIEIHRQRGDALDKNIPPGNTGVTIDDKGRAFVDVRSDVTLELQKKVALLKGTVVSTSLQHRSILAWVPLLSLERLAEDPAVYSIQPAATAITNRPAQPK